MYNSLIIDQGNTICKLAIFGEGEDPLEVRTCSELTIDFLDEIIKQFHPTSGILSSVKRIHPDIYAFLRASLSSFIALDYKTPTPLRNAYKTPETLGLDRLAAAVGAWSLQPQKPLLIVDMGTAITYDFVNSEGIYQGGNIAPGIRMRLKSLHQNTDKLPNMEPEIHFQEMGSDTQTAILGGVMQGVIYEMEGYKNQLQQKHSNLFTFLTGGDLIYFEEKLKNGIFVCKNLVLIGLNRILHYNVHS